MYSSRVSTAYCALEQCLCVLLIESAMELCLMIARVQRI